LLLAAIERFCYSGGRAGPSPAAKFPFKQFMVTVGKTPLLNDLASQREQELTEARAIQLGMLPQGPSRTADATICYEFQPFYEVGGDFLDFFTLTDDVIGIYLGDATGKGLPAALYAALAHACFDPRTGVLRIASAGMTGPVILSARGYRELETSRHSSRNVFGDGIRKRNHKTGTRRWGNFLERWSQRVAKLR
jgi:hypothetical protein